MFCYAEKEGTFTRHSDASTTLFIFNRAALISYIPLEGNSLYGSAFVLGSIYST